jgi:hypothetical protein
MKAARESASVEKLAEHARGAAGDIGELGRVDQIEGFAESAKYQTDAGCVQVLPFLGEVG